MLTYTDPISNSDFAKHVGMSRQRIYQMIQEGILRTDDNGNLGLADATQALAAYRAELEKRAPGKRRPKKPAAVPAAPAPVAASAVDEVRVSVAGTDDAGYLARMKLELDSDPSSVYARARAFNELQKARMSVTEADLQAGDCYTFEQIQADLQKVFITLRTKLLTIPSRLSTVCEGRNARDIEELIGDEINKVLEEFGKSKFA